MDLRVHSQPNRVCHQNMDGSTEHKMHSADEKGFNIFAIQIPCRVQLRYRLAGLIISRKYGYDHTKHSNMFDNP